MPPQQVPSPGSPLLVAEEREDRPDVLRARAIVADLLGDGRLGLGTLLEPADPMVIIGGSCYRLDAGMSARRAFPFEAVQSATVVGAQESRRFAIDYPVRRVNVARLAARLLGSLPSILGVQLTGTFRGVASSNATFGRADGTAVGFVRHISPKLEWELSFLTADRTFGGPVVELSLENVELTIVVPRVVYQAGTGDAATPPVRG